ncbi:MAG: hypothetical protein NVS9B10_29210 [Nevskia sp.]
MLDDNRVSATMSSGDVDEILGHLAAIRGKLPFLVTLGPQGVRELSKFGEKSVGFDEKCNVYMRSNPEFLPGYTDIAEIEKDRTLRLQMIRFFADMETLFGLVDETLRVVGSEIYRADLAYYNNVHEAARRGRPGAQSIYDDLRTRFPGAGRKPAAVKPVEKA